MIKLYYSNSKIYLTEQKNPSESLGNFPSSSVVPNNYMSNLFSMISQLTIENDTQEVIGVFLKNEEGVDISDLTLYFDYPENSQSKIEVAAVTPSQDSEGRHYIESIPNMNSLPYDATFYEADGVENKVNLGDLEADAYLGLWFKRTLNSGLIKTCDELYTDFENDSTPEEVEDISLVFGWDEDESSSSSSSS